MFLSRTLRPVARAAASTSRIAVNPAWSRPLTVHVTKDYDTSPCEVGLWSARMGDLVQRGQVLGNLVVDADSTQYDTYFRSIVAPASGRLVGRLQLGSVVYHSSILCTIQEQIDPTDPDRYEEGEVTEQMLVDEDAVWDEDSVDVVDEDDDAEKDEDEAETDPHGRLQPHRSDCSSC